MSDFSIHFAVDPDARLAEVQVTGAMDSARYVDEVMAYFAALPEAETFDRLIDLSQCRGYASYDDLQRLADFWVRRLAGRLRVVKVAVVTANALIHARMPTVDLMSQPENRRAFNDIAAARAWLSEPF